MGGHPGRILGCPWEPPDCLEGWVWGDIQGGPWDPPITMEGCVCEDIKGGSCDVLVTKTKTKNIFAKHIFNLVIKTKTKIMTALVCL